MEPLIVNGLGNDRADRQRRVLGALEAAGLRPGADFAARYPHELSGGQRQRVVIAGALVMGPELIVADEPVSMLDVSIRTELLRLMLDLRTERGLTYLFITHDLSLAWVIADRIAVMYLGKIMEIGPAERVIRSPHNPYTQALVSVSPSPDPPTAGTRAKRTILVGETPDAAHVPTGCRFHPRCPYVFDRCRVEEPPLVRRRRRPAGRVLAGRGRAIAARPAAARGWRGGPAGERRPGRPAGFGRPAGSGYRGRAGRGAGPDDPSREDLMSFDPADVSAVDGLEPLTPTQVAGFLRAARDHIVTELTMLGDAGSQWRPAPDEWSANECLGHIIEADKRGFGGRIGRILEQDGVAEQGWDQVGVAAARADNSRTLAAILAEFQAGRDAGIALVEGLHPHQLGRTAVHDRVGTVTVRDLIHEWVFHDRNHIRQILANTQARAWPAMGNAQRFSHPDR